MATARLLPMLVVNFICSNTTRKKSSVSCLGQKAVGSVVISPLLFMEESTTHTSGKTAMSASTIK